MRITKRQLRRIIREERVGLLKEQVEPIDKTTIGGSTIVATYSDPTMDVVTIQVGDTAFSLSVPALMEMADWLEGVAAGASRLQKFVPSALGEEPI